MLNPLIAFATRHPGVYFGTCAAIGLVIRWFWCDQDVARFINPLAPFFA